MMCKDYLCIYIPFILLATLVIRFPSIVSAGRPWQGTDCRRDEIGDQFSSAPILLPNFLPSRSIRSILPILLDT